MGGWSGSGTFSRTYNWTQDQSNGILVRADRHDVNDTDFVNGINNCLTKDGQNTPSADLPMAGYKHTGVANATASDQYAAFGQVLPLTGGALTGALTSSSTGSFTNTFNVLGEAGNAGRIRLFEDTDNGTDSVTIISPASLGSNIVVTAPSSAGTLVVTDASGNLGIGGAANANAILDVQSTTKQAIPAPVQTTVEKLALTPVNGGQVFDDTLKRPAWYNGSAWEYSPFGKRFTSTGQTITAAGSLTIAHGLGVTPFLVQAWAVCGTAEANYSIGDRMPMPIGITSTTGSNQGLTVVADATNLSVRFGSGGLILLDKTTGVGAALTAANWTIVFEAFA